MRRGLVIFVRNPVPGRVKTRLAATIGDKAAFETYCALLERTRVAVEGVAAEKYVYYSEYIDQRDLWDRDMFNKKVQQGEDLGLRMLNACNDLFEEGCEAVVLIGSDCCDLCSEHLEDAFLALEEDDVVIGPASDGGYYLVGMTRPRPEMFRNMPWSGPSVLEMSKERLKGMDCSLSLLECLDDIDTEEDLRNSTLDVYSTT